MQGLALTWPCYFYFGSAHPLLVGLKKKKKKSCFSSLLDLKVLLLAGGMVKDTAEYRMNDWMIVNPDLQNSCKPKKDHNNLSTKFFFPLFLFGWQGLVVTVQLQWMAYG